MNRNLLSLLVFLCIGLMASAQTEKGSWMIGGNLSLNTAKQNTQISVSPSAGYFIINNFAAGANVTVSYSKFGGNKSTTIAAGPFARYYFGTMNIRPFVEGDLNFTSDKKETAVVGAISTTENGTGYFLGGGLAAFINRNVAIEALAGYDHTSVSGGSGGFAFKIGFQVYLTRTQIERMKTRM